jgi:hypothetical protein
MTIKEFQEGTKELQEWTEDDWTEVEQILNRGNMTFKEFRRLFELAKTEEGQEYIHFINQYFLKFSSLLENVEISEAPSQWLLDRIREGGRIVWDLIHAVPKCLRTTMGDIRLLFFLRQIESPEVVLDILCKTALSERCRKEAIRRISPFGMDVVEAVFLNGTSQTDSVKAIMSSVQAHARRLGLPQEKGTSEARAEKDGILGELLSEQLAKLKNLSVEDFFIQAMEKKLDYLPDNIRNGFIEAIRKQSAQKRNPPGGYVYGDAEMETEDGKVPMFEIWASNYPALQTQQSENLSGNLEFTSENRRQLDEAFGKNAGRILELSYKGFSDKEIAKILDYKNQSPISKIRKRMQENYELIKKIIIG